MKRRQHRGQAAIEFMVVMLVIFFFLLLFLSFSLMLVVSEYMDYATFMAARTYKAGAGDRTNQQANAETVFNQYTRFITGNGLARNVTLNFTDAQANNEQTGGATASYDLDMFYLPPVFTGNNAVPSRIRLSSETFLGREVGVFECKNFFAQFVRSLNIPNMDRFTEEMDDNGC